MRETIALKGLQTIYFDRQECQVDLPLQLGTFDAIPFDFADGAMFRADVFELIIITEGNGHVILDGQRLDLVDGMAIFVSPFQVRQWFVDPAALDASYLLFKEEFLNAFFSDKLFAYRLQYFHPLELPLSLELSPALLEKISVVYGEIAAEMADFRCDSAHLIRSLLYFLLIRLNREYALANDLGTETQINNHAYRFKQLLEEHVHEKQRAQEYAEMIGISRITLNKAVKKQFKASPGKMIKQRMVAEIKNLLVYSEMTVVEIAECMNFSEPNHLIRFFRQQSGLTPIRFREDYQNGLL